MTFRAWLKKHGACPDGIQWVGDKTPAQAWEQCPRGDWMLWLYTKAHPDRIRTIALAAGHCANTVRHLMWDKCSKDAVDTAIAFGEGKIGLTALKNAAINMREASVKRPRGRCENLLVLAAAECVHININTWHTAYHTAEAMYYQAEYEHPVTEKTRFAEYRANQAQTADICRNYLDVPEIEGV